MDAIAGDKPFVLHPDGVGWLFVTSGLKDGPLPTHYEPLESPFGNPLYPDHAYESCGRSAKSVPTILTRSPATSASPTC